MFCRPVILGKAIEAPRFQGNRHMKVLGCQLYAPATFTPQETFLVLISVTG